MVLFRRKQQITQNPSEENFYISSSPEVIEYRTAYFEKFGSIPEGDFLPDCHDWPKSGDGLNYERRMRFDLNFESTKGAEIGPLNIPIVLKSEANVLYVDHLDTTGLKLKYPEIEEIPEVDRPIKLDSLFFTLEGDSPLDWLIASQAFEHLANPIKWLNDCQKVLRVGGKLSLGLPDSRITFDLLRSNSRPADLVSAFIHEDSSPDIRSVFDHHSKAAFVNMDWANSDSITHLDVINSRGAISPKIVHPAPREMIQRQLKGEYLDVHAWVFSPVSFLLLMSELVKHEFTRLKLSQFFPTDFGAYNRCNSSFIAILENPDDSVSYHDIRSSYLEPLG
jgi:hypothetical protein